jgi:hypothetical protein
MRIFNLKNNIEHSVIKFCKKIASIRFYRWLICLFLLLLVNQFKAKAQSDSLKNIPPPSIKELWHTKERFQYSVKFGFIRIGTVTLELMPDTVFDGLKCRYVRTIIKSNPAIPFIGNKEKHFNSLMVKNDTVPYTLMYWTDDVAAKHMKTEVYHLDYRKSMVYTFLNGKPADTLDLTSPSICGPAYFYLTRVYAGTDKQITTPIYIDQKEDKIVMDNSSEIEDIKSPAFPDDKVKSFVSRGRAGFDGPFGFSGRFTAWYAADSLRVPVATNVKVWLGNVRVRLIKYELLK